MAKQTGKELAREVENFVNGAWEEDMDDFVEGFKRMHNTLQQKTMSLIFKCVKAMAETEYVDGRNQASKERAIKMIDGYKEKEIESLVNDGTGYWTEEKAREHITSDYYDFTQLPLI